MPNQYSILVTGIGGNVGQGVLRNIRSFIPDCYVVGTDTSDFFTIGARYCNSYYKVPYATSNEFSDIIIDICIKENVNLIIPTTDYEVFHIGLLKDKLPTILGSIPTTTELCLDKFKTFEFFEINNLVFAESFLPSQYDKRWKNIIVKPREGRGSRNIFYNPEDINNFDDSFVIQKQLFGKEITTAFYVTKDNQLHGQITLDRSISNGMTCSAEVIDRYDNEINLILNNIISVMSISGPCNIQSIVTEDGIVPFEINCRYSGTNSIRSQFGFEDVRYGIEEYLLNIEPTKPIIIKGSALRIYLDVIYKDKSIEDLIPGINNSYIY